MDTKETLIEIIKHTHSTDGSYESAYERLDDIREAATELLRSIDPIAEQEVSSDLQGLS